MHTSFHVRTSSIARIWCNTFLHPGVGSHKLKGLRPAKLISNEVSKLGWLRLLGLAVMHITMWNKYSVTMKHAVCSWTACLTANKQQAKENPMDSLILLMAHDVQCWRFIMKAPRPGSEIFVVDHSQITSANHSTITSNKPPDQCNHVQCTRYHPHGHVKFQNVNKLQ